MPATPPIPANLPTLYAIRAMFDGNANESQQKLALEWLIFRACGTGEDPFVQGEDGRRSTDFNLGRQYVGRQIARLRSPEALAEIEARTKKPAPARKEAEK